MTTKIAIISNQQHQLFNTLKESSIALRQISVSFIDLDHNKFESGDFDLFIDFTVAPSSDKISFINNLNANVVSDLTFNNGDMIVQQCPKLVGALATGMHSPKNCYELWIGDLSFEQIIESIFCELKIDVVEAKTPGFGFIFPRTLAQIINEAYFSLEEDLATESDIDSAMKSGVNYPLGPIEWAKKSGLKNIHQLLSELNQTTNEARYIPSAYLLK